MQGGSFRCRSPKRASPGLDKREYSPPSAPCTAAWHAQHTYDLGGDLLTSGYNGAATLNFAYDNSQRLTGVTAPVSSGMPNLLSTLVSNVTPDPTYPLLMHSAAFGNGLTETRGYSPRMWLNSLQVGSVYSLGVSYAGNGDVTSANDSVNSNWTYGYDAFNRLTSAAKTGVSYTWDYDRFGNRWHQTQVGVGAQALTFNQDNQITNPGFIYDAAGNLMMDNINCYSYDAENRLASTVPETLAGVCGAAANGTDYLYDPDGRRVAKIQNGAIAKQFYYDAAGQEIAETNASGTLNRAEIFAGSRHLATWNPAGGGTTYFNHSDWLGTERARSNSSGTVCWAQSSLPFGDGVTTITNNCTPTPNFFTGKERDTETASSPNANDGLDYFGARYDSSNLGRFMTPDWSADPEPVPYAKLDSPQSLNLYSYVLNNPLSSEDPDGHGVWDWIKGAACDLGVSSACTPPPPPPPSQQQQEQDNKQRLVKAQDSARSNPAFQPEVGGTTHCNAATCSVAQQTGAPTGPLTDVKGVPVNSNQQAENLSKSGKYREVTPQEAQQAANKGVTVFVGYENPNPRASGHTATVRPLGVPGDNPPPHGRGPLINDIGRSVAVHNENYAFTRDMKVHYYVPRGQ